SEGQIVDPSGHSTRIEQLVRDAQSLPDHQLQHLIWRLNALLPEADQPGQLATPYLSMRRSLGLRNSPTSPDWSVLSQTLFGRADADKLYSAPRRFDLAT